MSGDRRSKSNTNADPWSAGFAKAEGRATIEVVLRRNFGAEVGTGALDCLVPADLSEVFAPDQAVRTAPGFAKTSAGDPLKDPAFEVMQRKPDSIARRLTEGSLH